MSYKRNQRKKTARRKRDYPKMFNGDIQLFSFNWSSGPNPDRDKAAGRLRRYHSTEQFMASL